MIQTKQDLKEYIKKDRSRYILRPSFLHYYFFGDETYATLKFLKRLRKTEYYFNNLNRHNPFTYLRFAISFFIYRRLQLKYRLLIPLNVVGPGLYIPHRIGGVIINAQKVGCNLSINSGCVIGKKNINENRPIIGSDVEICIGAKVIGKVNVGNNVTIAPNSVVIKDVLDNIVVGGVPAQILKNKNSR